MRVGKLRMAVGVGVLLAVSGCVGSEPLPTLPATPTATPIFASEEEALAAAADAYAEYGATSDLIASEGGEDPERIEPFVTPERLPVEMKGFEALRDSGLRIVGSTTFEVLDLQRVDSYGEDLEVVFYACLDLSASRAVDADGVDVTPANREDRLMLEVLMRTVGGELPLLLESDEQWPESSC